MELSLAEHPREVVHTSLTLLTLNGRVKNRKMKSVLLENCKCGPVKKIRNFYMLKVPNVGVSIFVYLRGAFKITVSNELGCRQLWLNINRYLNTIVDLLDVFYTEPIDDIDMGITQISITMTPFQSTNVKMTYEGLLRLFEEKNCMLHCKIGGYTLRHEINWVGYEAGLSSYYFKVVKDEDILGGIKLYNNLKAVTMCFKIDVLLDLCALSKDFILHLVKCEST